MFLPGVQFARNVHRGKTNKNVEIRGYFLFCWSHCQELSRMEFKSCFGCQFQRSFILLVSATSFGGSPTLRSAKRIGTMRPVMPIAASITSSTEYPLPVPTL